MSPVGWNGNMTVYVASIIVSNHNMQDLCAGGTKRQESTFKFSNQANSIAINFISMKSSQDTDRSIPVYIANRKIPVELGLMKHPLSRSL